MKLRPKKNLKKDSKIKNQNYKKTDNEKNFKINIIEKIKNIFR